MNDTTPEMAKLQHDLLMSLSGFERMRMGCSMFDTAKALAYASFGAVSEEEKCIRWFLRCYGNDFDDAGKARIIAGIKERFRSSENNYTPL